MKKIENLYEFEIEHDFHKFPNSETVQSKSVHVCVLELLDAGRRVEVYYKHTRHLTREKPTYAFSEDFTLELQLTVEMKDLIDRYAQHVWWGYIHNDHVARKDRVRQWSYAAISSEPRTRLRIVPELPDT